MIHFKRALSLGILLFSSARAHAAITDSFECSIQFTGRDGYPDFESQYDVVGVRSELTNGDLASTKFSDASASHAVQVRRADGKTFEIRTSLSYRHAVLFDAQNHAVQGALHTCHNMTLTSSSDVTHLDCAEATPDPFDVVNGNWFKASVAGGAAHFPIRHWQMSASPLEGDVFYSCNFKETRF